VLETLAGKIGLRAARQVWEWSKGSEARQMTKLLRDEHPAAEKLLVQPDCLFELTLYATTGEFDPGRMLAAVRQVEPDPEAAEALAAAIESTQWRTKRDKEAVHWEVAKLSFDVRAEVTESRRAVLERLERLVVPAAAPLVPERLPRVPRSFTDRERERERLAAALRDSVGDASARIAAIRGMPGIGKSALAVRVAHDVRAAFPDGQLYESLRAPDGTAIAVEEVAARLLRGLGVPDSVIPDAPAERAALLRSHCASRSLLVVLDNVARDDPAIAALIPASPTCAVLITSWAGVDTLEPDLQVTLTALAEEDAVVLLGRLLPGDRVAAEPEAARALAAGGACLPMALRAIAGWLAQAPELTLASAVEQLPDGAVDDALRETFMLSYAQLTPEAAGLFRRLGAVRAAPVGPSLASTLSSHDPSTSQRLLDELVAAGLVDREAAGVRMHELMHRFATAKLREDPEEEALARERVSAWMLANAEREARQLGGEDGADA